MGVAARCQPLLILPNLQEQPSYQLNHLQEESSSCSKTRMLPQALLLSASLVAAQDLNLCKERESHFTYGGHNYVYSGKSNLLDKSEAKSTQTGASQWCEQRCMALVSLETEGEWVEVRRRMESWKAPFIWTSGHICDKSVGEACFTTESLQPRLINAWFWSGSGSRLGATDRPQPGWRSNPWGTNGLCSKAGQACNDNPGPGHKGVRQPDNAEQRLAELIKSDTVLGTEESCLALATGLWQDETVWNDISCYHEKEWICEDSEKLLEKMGLA